MPVSPIVVPSGDRAVALTVLAYTARNRLRNGSKSDGRVVYFSRVARSLEAGLLVIDGLSTSNSIRRLTGVSRQSSSQTQPTLRPLSRCRLG